MLNLFCVVSFSQSFQFVPKTHYFFSASKDKTVKYWDADKFLHVMTLEGHHSEIWCLAVSFDGEFVVGLDQQYCTTVS